MGRKWEEIEEWQSKAFHNLVHLIRWLINSLWSHFIRKHKNDNLCLLPLLLWQNVGQRQEKKRLRWLTVDVAVMTADTRGRRSHHICYQEAEKHAQLAFLCVRPSPTPSPTDEIALSTLSLCISTSLLKKISPRPTQRSVSKMSLDPVKLSISRSHHTDWGNFLTKLSQNTFNSMVLSKGSIGFGK